MAYVNQNIDLYAGEIRSVVVTVDDLNSGSVEDLTSATISWKVKQGSTTALSKTVGSGITLASDPTTGVFTISLQAADTSSLVGVYSHEGRVTLSDGTIATMFTGSFVVRATLI